MKKILFLMLGIAAMLASCSRDEEALAESTAQQVTFSLSADGQEPTRSSAAVTRYVMAIYDEAGENKVVPETVFD